MNIESLSAGVPVRYNVTGRYFRLIETTGPVSLTFYRRSAEIAESLLVEAGYSESWLETDEGFEAVEVVSATAQQIKFAVRTESSLSYDRAVGNVAVTNTGGDFITSVTRTVLNTASFLASARPGRRYLLIQNRSATGTIWVKLSGSGSTQATGVKITPGGSLELSNYVTTTYIDAVGDIASNPDVLVVEG